MINLRPLTENDLPFLLKVRNDDSTRQFLENNSKFTLKQSLKWFRETQPKWYIIEVNRFSVGYIRTNGDEVGCDIHPNFRKKGYAKIAYELYLKDKDYASLWVFEDNFAKNLYEKLGFVTNGKSITIRDRNYIQMEYNGK
jgi:ribosomal protein S18 acetylase RimI-like enzyme